LLLHSIAVTKNNKKGTAMAQSAPQVFSGITPENYATLIEKAQAAGLSLSGNSGTAAKFGVEMSWNYSPESLELTIQCLGTPFFVKPEQVNAKIQALVTETLGQVPPSAG
jgi:hypothetical protein